LKLKKQYWMKMVDLAYDIHETLLLLKQGEQKTETKNIFRRKTIYLAETGHDLSVQRNIIKRELSVMDTSYFRIIRCLHCRRSRTQRP